MALLVQNDSKVVYTTEINLYFDDKSEKHMTLSKDDNVIVTYRSNGEKLIKNGTIKDILPVKAYDTEGSCSYGCCSCNSCTATGMIVLDSSKDFNSEVVNILLRDILDIEKVSMSDEATKQDPDEDIDPGYTLEE